MAVSAVKAIACRTQRGPSSTLLTTGVRLTRSLSLVRCRPWRAFLCCSPCSSSSSPSGPSCSVRGWCQLQALAVLGLTMESPLQTVMLLQLVVGANLVLFASGPENGFLRRSWAQAPLFSLLFFAQLATTLMCALGLLVEPISWQVIGWVWGYNLVWLAILRGVWFTAEGVAAFLAADGIDPGGAERPVVAITTAAAPGKRPRPYLISSERAPDQHR